MLAVAVDDVVVVGAVAGDVLMLLQMTLSVMGRVVVSVVFRGSLLQQRYPYGVYNARTRRRACSGAA